MLYYGPSPVASFATLIARYRSTEFDSPTRSTVPLLSLLQHGNHLWRTLLVKLGLEPGQTAVHLEYTVMPRKGRGGKSCTDAMLIGGGRACAVEAKWTEPAYPTVKDWLGPQPGSLNRRAVLDGWLSLLRPHVSGELRTEDFSGVTYQLVHRAASVCAAAESPGLSYLLFTPRPDGSPTDTGSLRSALEELASALGHPAGFPLRLVEVEVRPTPAFERIRVLPKGDPATGQAVRRALLDEPLFSFPGYRIHNVGGVFR